MRLSRPLARRVAEPVARPISGIGHNSANLLFTLTVEGNDLVATGLGLTLNGNDLEAT